ncbi:hypothetical protein D5086_013111 [Populus alba]|uniref:Uncharacterized protein n=1 Tax=Populus alba TaxID=43335 RepID=A0ACC4C6U4_POPAL
MQRIQAQIVIEIINHSLTRGQESLDHLLNGIKMSALIKYAKNSYYTPERPKGQPDDIPPESWHSMAQIRLGTPEDWSIPFVSLAKDFLSQCGIIDESQNTSFSSAGLGNYHSSTLDLLPSLALLDETCPMVGNTMGTSLFHIVPL